LELKFCAQIGQVVAYLGTRNHVVTVESDLTYIVDGRTVAVELVTGNELDKSNWALSCITVAKRRIKRSLI
jgi:hypothetical protein